jgi:Tfp pilus assembly protein PilO
MLFGKRQQLAICLLGAMFVGDFIFFGYMPLRTRLKELESQQAAKQAVITQAASEKPMLPVIKQQLIQLQATVGNFEAAIPRQRDIGDFVQKIGGIMSDYNLKDQVIQPSEQLTIKDLNCIRIKMQCKGSLKQIFKFFKQLQSMGRMVRIEEVKLLTGGDFVGPINMEAKAVIYYQDQNIKG